MKVNDLLQLSTRMFRTRPLRTWLTVLGISVGISAVLFLVALGYGMQNIVLQKIVLNEAMLSLTVIPKEELIELNDKMVADFLAIPNVENVAPVASVQAQMSYGGIHSAIDIKGVNPNYFAYAGREAKNGSLLTEKSGTQVVITDAVLKLFDMSDPESMIGRKISLTVFMSSSTEKGLATTVPVEFLDQFTVVGIVEDSQNGYVYIPLHELTKYVPVTQYEQAHVKVKETQYLTEVKEVVISKGYQTQSLSETIDQANKIFRVIQIVLGLFGAVALVVSYIGMFNTMTVTLLERTNEIGIMRAIGASKISVRNLFLTEAIVIAFLGGVTGILLGIFGGETFNMIINILAVRFGGTKVDLFLYPQWFLIAILGLSLFIGFFSGTFPAKRAASMDPLEALRYK